MISNLQQFINNKNLESFYFKKDIILVKNNDHFLEIGIFNPLDTIQDIYYFASLDINDFQKIKDLKIAIKATIKLFHKGELKEIWQTLN